MLVDAISLDQALVHHLSDAPSDVAWALRDTLGALAQACADIGEVASRGALMGEQQPLTKVADQLMAKALSACPQVAGWASAAHSQPQVSPRHARQGGHLVVFDPLDGSSNIDANISIGTIFSVLPHTYRGSEPGQASYMQPGRAQLAAGYVLYGPATMLVLSCRRGVLVFTLDRSPQSFAQPPCWVLTRTQVGIPSQTSEFAVNSANQRFWEKPVQRYVAECVAGENGPRMKDFNMRWVASMVAEVHRIMTRGGVFLYPRDTREPRKPGRLRLMYEVAPLAMLIEQAGGRAVNGTSELLDLIPDTLHQRVPVILGSRDEVDRIVHYHAEPHENVSWQLFKTRSLFVQAQA